MPEWHRPSFTPTPTGQIITDRLRRLDPHRWAKRLAVAVMVLLVVQTAWQWRSTTVALGQTTPVLVARQSIAAGTDITLDYVDIVDWPIGLLPDQPLSSLPVDAVAIDDIIRGEVLVAPRLRPPPDSLDADRRLIALPRTASGPDLMPGTEIELFGMLPIGDGLATPVTLLTSGTVHAVSDNALTIDIPHTAVPVVVQHHSLGVIEIVARGS